MPRYCTSCGFKNEDDSAFCESCGAAIAAAPSRAEQPVMPEAPVGASRALPPSRTPGRGWWLAIGAVLVGVIGAAIAEFTLSSRPISSALSGFGLRLPGGGGSGNTLYMVGRDGKWG